MSQENVELVCRAFDAFNRRDLDAYLALMDDDVEAVPRAGAIEGEAAIAATTECVAPDDGMLPADMSPYRAFLVPAPVLNQFPVRVLAP